MRAKMVRDAIALCVSVMSLACGDSGSTGTGAAGGSGGAGGDGGGGGAGASGGGGGATILNGCEQATAEDMTGNPEIDLDWVLPTQACLVVSNGAMINFIGDFSLHPLSGGSPGAPLDDDITNLDQSGPQATYIPATFGAHPFFCTIHSTSMQGVIYVVE